MGRLTIDIDDEIKNKLAAKAKVEGISMSEWVLRQVKKELATDWPESVSSLAGAWKDIPLAEEGRSGQGRDADREPF